MYGTKRLFWQVLFLFALLLALIVILRPKAGPKPIYVPVGNMTLIAHAGGGLPQGIYSNAREAFDLSVQNGFTLIEVDFSLTKNGEIVLIHDWRERYYQYFSRLTFIPPILASRWPRQSESAVKFSSLKMNHDLTQMTLDDLIIWLENNPNVKIVTDVKGDNVKAMTQISAKVKTKAEQYQNRFIAQIYAPDEYTQIIDLGYTDIIFTAYRSPLNDEQLTEFARTHHLFALTVPAARASKSLTSALAKIGTPVYAHTLNTNAQAEALKNMGVTGLYTDYLFPEH